MFTFKPIKFRLSNERLLSCKQFVKLFEANRQAIVSAKFIPAKLGSRTVGGHVQVELRMTSLIESHEDTAIEQYNKELEEAVKQIEKGNFITQEELEKEMEKW